MGVYWVISLHGFACGEDSSIANCSLHGFACGEDSSIAN